MSLIKFSVGFRFVRIYNHSNVILKKISINIIAPNKSEMPTGGVQSCSGRLAWELFTLK